MVTVTGLAIGLLAAASTASSESGTVCINRFGPDPPQPCPTGTADVGINPVPEFRWESTRFKIQIDALPPAEISCHESATVVGVPLGVKHKVAIWVESRRLETFFFRFEEKGSERLCLDFVPFYGTWQLEAFRPGTTKPCICSASRND